MAVDGVKMIHLGELEVLLLVLLFGLDLCFEMFLN